MEKVMPGKCQWMAVNRIKTKAPFNSLFPVDNGTVNAVAEHMKVNGYDQSQPIVLWKEKLDEDRKQAIVIDGHTRLLAAKKIGLSPVYVARVSFASADAALEYAIHNQRDRRNLTDADLLRCIEAVDERKPRGGDRKSEAVKSKTSSEAIDSGKSAEQTALIVGTSKTKVEKARTLLDYADEQTKQTVLDGKKSIHAAAKETQEKRKGKSKEQKQKPRTGLFNDLLTIGAARRPPDSSDQIKEIWELAHLMSDCYMFLEKVKPIIVRYCKNPLAKPENAQVVDHFLGWVEAWNEIFTSILKAKTEAELMASGTESDPETIVPEAPEVTTKDFQKKVVESDVPALVYFSFSDYEHYKANREEYSEAQRKKGELCST